jgi:ABC-type multidrug transport system fused ATPase/permease subunit
MIAVIAVGNVVMSYFRILTAHLHGSYLTQRLRNAVMRRLVHQPAAWYDLLPNAIGLPQSNVIDSSQPFTANVQGVLARDCPSIRFVFADKSSVFTLTIGCLLFGVAIALYSCYEVGLVILGCLPLSVVALYLGANGG